MNEWPLAHSRGDTFPHKPRIVARVSPEESPRLQYEAEKPFKPEAAKQDGRLGLDARKNVEDSSHSEHHGRGIRPIRGHPPLLLGASQAYEQDLDTGAIDLFNLLFRFALVVRAKRGAVRVGDSDPWPARPHQRE